MNFGIATAQNASCEKTNYPTETPRIGQVERHLQELDQACAFLEKHAEQLFNRLTSVVVPVPAQQANKAEGGAHGGVLCTVAERLQASTDRIRRVVGAMETAAGLIEL